MEAEGTSADNPVKPSSSLLSPSLTGFRQNTIIPMRRISTPIPFPPASPVQPSYISLSNPPALNSPREKSQAHKSARCNEDESHSQRQQRRAKLLPRKLAVPIEPIRTPSSLCTVLCSNSTSLPVSHFLYRECPPVSLLCGGHVAYANRLSLNGSISVRA